MAEQLEAKAYFAHPHSWERGLNENTNGLIRQYFPKGSDFSQLTAKEVQRVEALLNSRPRKCLAYQTPNDIFYPPRPACASHLNPPRKTSRRCVILRDR